MLWVRVAGLFIGALYHPPRPQYGSESLLDYIEACVDELSQQAPAAPIVLTTYFNQLSDGQLTEKTGQLQIVRLATRGPNVWDRIFVTSPMYNIVRVVTSVMRGDHKAVVAYAEQPSLAYKTSQEKRYRPVLPAQHVAFLH